MEASDIILKWMKVAARRDLNDMHKELVILRDFIDGLIREDEEVYMSRYIPSIRKRLDDMRQTPEVEAVHRAFDAQIKNYGWVAV